MSDEINFSFKVDRKKLIRNIVLVIAILSVLSLTYWLHKLQPNLEYSELAKVTTGAFVLIGLIYSIMTYELTQKKNRHDAKMQKNSATYNSCSEWHSLTMMNHTRILGDFKKKPDFLLINTDIQKFIEFIEDSANNEYKTSYMCVFNYFESLSIAATEGLMDEDFIRKYFSGVFIRYYDDYFPVIKQRRISKQDPDLLIGFTHLVEKWKNK